MLEVGDSVYFNEGTLRAEVIDISTFEMKVRFKEAGIIPPGSQLRIEGHRYEEIPVLNTGDLNDLKSIYEKFPYEYVSVPGVLESKDLLEVKLSLGDKIADKIQILAKIDNKVGLT